MVTSSWAGADGACRGWLRGYRLVRCGVAVVAFSLVVLTGDVGQSRERRLVAAGGVWPVMVVVVQPAVELAPAFGL